MQCVSVSSAVHKIRASKVSGREPANPTGSRDIGYGFRVGFRSIIKSP